MDKSEPSSGLIIWKGQWIVNIPTSIVILIAAIAIYWVTEYMLASVVLGSWAGWWVWARQLEKWKTWAFSRGVSPERLYRVGRLGLVNFYRYRIIEPDVPDKSKIE